jgi:hypothetical protein
MEMDWNQVRRRRLWRHSLLERAPASRLLDVVRQTCGIHAQLMPAAELLVAGHRDRAAGGTGRFPVLLIEGAVGGVWTRRQRGRRLEVRVEPFGRLNASLRRQLEGEVARVGAILESEPELIIGPVEVRAHL